MKTWLTLAVACMLAHPAAHAQSVGRFGPVYEIAEQDMLDAIYQRLNRMEASGELEAWKQRYLKETKARIITPARVVGVARATKRRSFDFDPSVRFDEPIVDGAGRIVVPAGTVVNPLTISAWTFGLFFFDGTDPAQVKAAKAAVAKNSSLMPILVAGSPKALMKDMGTRVWFDQLGLMTKRLGIRAVPATVSQAGSLLRIDEVPTP